MARRLTPDPLTTDPWAYPVRISFPQLWRYVAIWAPSWLNIKNRAPLTVVEDTDSCTTSGLDTIGDVIADKGISRVVFNDPPLVRWFRQEPLGIGSTPEEEADLWQYINSRELDDWDHQNFTPEPPENYPFDTAANGTGIADGSCDGIPIGGSSFFDFEDDNFTPITYLYTEYRSNSGIFVREPRAVRDIDEGGSIRHNYPKDEGALSSSGNPICCDSSPDGDTTKQLHRAGDLVIRYDNYPAKQGLENTEVIDPSGRSIPVKPIGWIDRVQPVTGSSREATWIFERTDLSYDDEGNVIT